MNRGKIGRLVLVVASTLTLLTLSGRFAHSAELMPLDPVPAAYAKKKMPTGWWTDTKVIKEGKDIYFGEAIPLVACHSCHGQDGRPVSSGGAP
ncbi:MAG: hypothetical protein HC801_02215 [Nitrospira sp.]|nr:hypothetical protein [Nitrospira sp.]